MEPEQQTTRETSVAANTEISGLIGIVNDLREEVKRKQKRIEQLEFRLAQRIQKTKNLYQERKAKLDEMKDRVYKIFLDFGEVAWTYEELQEEWASRYPNVSSVNLPRRVRELAEMGLLWAALDPESKKVYHYLRLEDLQDDKTISKRAKNSNIQKMLGELVESEPSQHSENSEVSLGQQNKISIHNPKERKRQES